MSFDECIEEPQFYKDPDYDGPLEEEWELEEGEEFSEEQDEDSEGEGEN